MSSQIMCISLGMTIAALALVAAPAAGRPAMPPGFVDAATVVPGLRTDIRYAGAHNFTGAPVTGYAAPRCWLTRQAADALAAVQADLAPRGLGLLVYDCYRPLRAVARFVDWAKRPGEETGKREFYPDIAKNKLFVEGYIAARSAHSRGSTVDLTLVELGRGRPLEMGTPFDLFGPASHPDAPGLPPAASADRALLAEAMARRGFAGYDKEWWHFTLRDEPYPATAFDVPIE